MNPFNPKKAQFYYDTASRFQEALMRSGNQLLEYEDKIRTLKNEIAELQSKIAALQSDRDYWRGRANEPLIETRGSYTPPPNMVPFPKPNKS